MRSALAEDNSPDVGAAVGARLTRSAVDLVKHLEITSFSAGIHIVRDRRSLVRDRRAENLKHHGV